jgi:hypothetical protein
VLVIVDDFSRYSEVFSMKAKDEAFLMLEILFFDCKMSFIRML